jgi:hypothetical protein
MNQKPRYYLNKKGAFVIDNYHIAKPFSSFFSGIAGRWGVPVWVFYVNRGQAVASFGIKDKDHPIMEFQPANKAYYLTPILGFRTFIKTTVDKKAFLYDAFSTSLNFPCYDIKNSMAITSDGLALEEINRTLGLETVIEYFTIPHDDYGALARKVTIKNVSADKRRLDILDGLPQIQPYGLNNMFLKQMSRTIEAWVMVENHNNGIPFIRLKVEPADRPEVTHVKSGNFYAAFDTQGIIRPVVDPGLVFGRQNDLTFPRIFSDSRYFHLPERQSVKSKTPCAFAFKRIELRPSEDYTVYTISGNMSSIQRLKSEASRILDITYFDNKQSENRALTASLQAPVFTKSSLKGFDMYCAQNFLDNIMRGGLPVSIEHASGKTTVYLYSRKHGDLERDYNMFLLEPSYFSQGNGNYRDVNQNRRSDIWFNPDIGMENVLSFFNLIQTDGYNPLVICPDRFRFNQDFTALAGFFNRYGMNKMKDFFKDDFTPGELFSFMEFNDVMLRDSRQALLEAVMENSTKHTQALHGEGFWIDHWHYCLDILEAYAGLYPERLDEVLFGLKIFTFFDNAYIVQPREKKYVLYNGRLRQSGGVIKDEEKDTLISGRRDIPNVSRTGNGKGDVYKTSLIAKMIIVVVNKFASLDPFDMGIEMEADKPGWYDSLNGLPGILGSSLCETFELKRWILFLKNRILALSPDKGCKVNLPVEAYHLLRGLNRVCGKELGGINAWEKRSSLKEGYRAKTALGFKGTERQVTLKAIGRALDSFLRVIDKGLRRAYDKRSGLYPSYFINEVVKHKITSVSVDKIYARPMGFRQKILPLFLEGMVHAIRVNNKPLSARGYYKAVRSSDLYDKALGMYKVCASLEKMPEEIGRARIFAPGWLENESIWLHMEYKYMLELLKAGLYKEFYDNLKDVFIPFLEPGMYGRSVLENSSFIVSSAFPEGRLHGTGFIARLSGSTAEFINIWLIICAGKRPFYLDAHGMLRAEFKPVLPSWFFTKKEDAGFPRATFSFRFLDKTLVVYHNKARKDTFGRSAARVKQVCISYFDGREIIQKSPQILPPCSYDLRSGKISRIDIMLK